MQKKRLYAVFVFAATLIIALYLAVLEPINQEKLARLAVSADDPKDRLAAVEKLTDQAVLAKIALTDKDPVVRHIAANKLTDSATLDKTVLTKMGMWVKPELTLQVTIVS